MTPTATDPRLVEVWVAMADHFLDTETRYALPLTALRCVEAGLTLEEAQLVWANDVWPVVGANLYNVAGEWAAWDRCWLVKRVQRRQRSWWHRLGTTRTFRHWLRGRLNYGDWLSIARCIELLLDMPPGVREQTARDLVMLARHCFDFCPQPLRELDAAQIQRLRQLHAGPFCNLVEPALLPEERREAFSRVDSALAAEAAV